MEDRWDLKGLSDLIRAKEPNPDYLLELVQSVGRAIQIFRYHLYEARDALAKIEPSTTREAMELIFTPDDKREHISKVNLVIQANIQAAIHSARAIHDLFAQLVRKSLSLTSISIKACSIKTVRKELPKSQLKSCLDGLLGSAEFKYIDAFVNTIKHRDLVQFGPLASLESGECGFQFRAFKFNEDFFPALWAKEVLEYAIQTKNVVIMAGQLLNKEYGAYGGHDK